MRQFADLSLIPEGIPAETTILNFRHLLETYVIANGVLEAVNLVLPDQGISVRKRMAVDAHIGVHFYSGLVHTVPGTVAN